MPDQTMVDEVEVGRRDVLEPINSKSKFFPGPKECFQIDGHWKVAPW
jgi:hypothetical protein